ncbi:MAG: metallophosphoesterase [Anaerolineales bacterium]
MVRLGVVTDSHIPDRMWRLPAAALERLAGVDAILHAGDVSTRGVLEALGRVAPVYAVGGNRDVLLGLPRRLVLEFEGVRLGLAHGHGGLWGYLREKVLYFTVGFYHERYLRQVRAQFEDVAVIVFGHSHRPVNRLIDGVLMFNPGSLGPDYRVPYGPAIGFLTIEAGRVSGEIVPLNPD